MWMPRVLAVAAAVGFAAGAQVVSSVQVLGTDNFEHLTQASTGATTGDWLIKFYAPWCGHCKRMAPTWDELATKLHQKTNVAKVDCTAEKSVCSRFSIRGYPTLLFFKGGKYTSYDGNRDVDSLEKFAKDRGGDGPWTDVPGLPGMFDNALSQVEGFLMTKWVSEDPMINAVVMGLGLGVVIIILFSCCMMIFMPEDDDAVPPPAVSKKTDGDDAAVDGDKKAEAPKKAPASAAATPDKPIRQRTVKATQ